MLLIRNARIATEHSPGLTSADILIENGIISRTGPDLPAPADARVIDAAGRVALPGMFDAHVHFREPGFENKETISSGTEAAINGGVTGVVMMPNTIPAIDSGTVARQVLEIARRDARIPVFTSGCVTKGRHGKELAGIDGLRDAGVVMLTDDGDTTADPAVLYRAMQYATEFGMFFLAGIPRLTETVGYDPRFSGGHFGVWCECAPNQQAEVEAIMRRHGAVEVRGDR
jgi:dihydroorotase